MPGSGDAKKKDIRCNRLKRQPKKEHFDSRLKDGNQILVELIKVIVYHWPKCTLQLSLQKERRRLISSVKWFQA